MYLNKSNHKHICNSHRPTLMPKIAEELARLVLLKKKRLYCQAESKKPSHQHRVCAMAGEILKLKSLHLINFIPNRKVVH